MAIKCLRLDFKPSKPQLLERFVREGEVPRQLDHPNIVKMLATVEENGQHYIVMEYVCGGSLRDLLDRQPSPPLLDLADALTLRLKNLISGRTRSRATSGD